MTEKLEIKKENQRCSDTMRCVRSDEVALCCLCLLGSIGLFGTLLPIPEDPEEPLADFRRLAIDSWPEMTATSIAVRPITSLIFGSAPNFKRRLTRSRSPIWAAIERAVAPCKRID